jgi:hypothetical protein
MRDEVRVLAAELRMSDSDDPYLMAAFPLHQWQQTTRGKFIMENCLQEPTFICQTDPVTMAWKIKVTAYLTSADALIYAMLQPGARWS